MYKDIDSLYLCNFDGKLEDCDDEIIQALWSGKWSLENKDICKEILSNIDCKDIEDLLRKHIENGTPMEKILQLAISAFLTFCNNNWSPKPVKFDLKEYFGIEWTDIDIYSKLECDSEPIFVNIKNPELLYFALQLFNALYEIENSFIHLWWCLRGKVTHQRVLEDTSATLYSELEHIIAKLTNELQVLQNTPRLNILLCTEIAQAYLMYGRVQKVEEYLLKGRTYAGLKLELTGILGKRTKFQQQSLPQLALSSELDDSIERPSAEQSHGTCDLPSEVELDDDVRMDKIQYIEKPNQTELPSLEQTLCLLTVQHLQKAQPKDNLLDEEIQPYIAAVLSQSSGAWSTRVAALLIRCKIEANHKRTVERAIMQCEIVINDNTDVPCTSRLSYLWASGLQPAWTWKQQLADLYLSLGLVKAALEEYTKLQLWEEVIVCYTILQLRHKAAEVIRQQLEIKETVKLYCLLGDATDDVSYYEKAWQFSNEKSSRAQRHWGNYLFDHKRYEECIPHYETSVQINSIQESVWLRLGYAALMTERWELSATAYRRYTYLQPNSFEAWNNLAKVYVKLGDKNRAYRALIEALRFNYDNWKLWENVIMVSMDTGHLDDVIRGVHRLLDLQHKFDDVEVLSMLVCATLKHDDDSDGDSVARLKKRVLELFGRITSVHHNKPEIWQLYSNLSPTYLLKGQRLLKAYRGYTQNSNWSNNPDTCKNVIELVISLLDYSLKASKEVEEKEKLQANQQLSSARLTGQGVIKAAEKQNWPETDTCLEELKGLFSNVTEYIKSNM